MNLMNHAFVQERSIHLINNVRLNYSKVRLTRVYSTHVQEWHIDELIMALSAKYFNHGSVHYLDTLSLLTCSKFSKISESPTFR